MVPRASRAGDAIFATGPSAGITERAPPMRRRDPWSHPSIARRPWHATERRVVTRGFWGRFFIAIEPLTIAMCFTGLAAGLLLLHREGAIFIAPIFAGAAILFMIYAVVLMVPVTRALIETFGSIWVVDGYVRYREHAARDRDTCLFRRRARRSAQRARRMAARQPARRARPGRTVAGARRVHALRRGAAHRRTLDRRAARRRSRRWASAPPPPGANATARRNHFRAPNATNSR